MEDEETSSQWSHLMGRAMAGQLKGSELEVLPSEMTDWGTWKAQHPGTDVLDMSRTTSAFVTEMQKEPDTYTLGLRLGGDVADFPFNVLQKTPVLATEVGETPVLVTYAEGSATARAFRRTVGDRILHFRREGERLMDAETGSVWDAATGKCMKGELKGRDLEMLPGILSFVKAWRIFYPGSKTYGASR